MNLPTLRQLQYLVAVVELRHFGQAAARCFVTQSTLSAGIQELENLLGVTLIERNKRTVLPTLLGETLATQARQVLHLTEALVKQAHYAETPLCGPLRLGVIPTIGPYLLPRLMPGIRQAFPRLELRLIEAPSAQLLEQLTTGTLDAAILAFPYPIGQLAHQLFWAEDFWIALPKNHSLAAYPSIATQDLPKDELLLLAEGHCLTDHALGACHLEGSKSRAAFQGTSLYTLLLMVAGGQGVTFVPEMARLAGLFGAQDISLVRLAEPGPHRQIGLVWRPGFFRPADLQLFATHLHRCLASTEVAA